MNEDTRTIYYAPHDGRTFVLPDGRLIRTKQRSQGITTLASEHFNLQRLLDHFRIPVRAEARFVSQREYLWLQAIQDIVHRWWSSLGIEQYESERIERMNRWARR